MRSIYVVLFLFAAGMLYGQQSRLQIIVKGQPREGGLPMATVKVGNAWQITDENGRAEFILEGKQKHLISIGYTSYHDTTLNITVKSDTSLVVILRERKFNLTQVEVRDQRLNEAEYALRKEVMRSEVTQADVKARPLIGGEPDIIKPLQSVPGVQAGLPGSADLYIRGADQYQNSIMLDGFPIYNISHGYGYMSAIPPTVTQKLTLYKEGYPVEYGGAVSSFINADIRKADTRKWDGELGVGLGSFNGNVSLPVKKGKSGILIGGRFSTTGLMLEALNSVGVMVDDFTTGYNDIILKYHDRLAPNKQLEVIAYYASDYIKNETYPVEGKTGANNMLLGVTYRHQYPEGWNTVQKLHGFNYRYKQDYTYINTPPGYDFEDGDKLKYFYYVNNIGWEGVWRKTLTPNLKLKVGGEFNLNAFHSPSVETQTSQPYPQYPDTTGDFFFIYNPVGFSEVEWQPFQKLRITPGVRLSPYYYGNNSTWKILPRLALNYAHSKRLAFFTAYDRSAQATHRYRNTIYGSALDFPVHATADLPIQTTDQYAIGGVLSVLPVTFHLQGFYRDMQNVVDRNYYADQLLYDFNAVLLPPLKPEEVLVSVDGYSYGLEAAIGFKKGIFNWNAAYTWSRSKRSSPRIDKGREFNFEYNREHYFKTDLIVRFKRNSIDKIVQIGASYTYGTGFFSQFPLMFQNAPGVPGSTDPGKIVSQIPYRNNVQLPDMQHLDLTFNFIAQKKRGIRTFSISIFNVLFAPLITQYGYDSGGDLNGIAPFTVFPSISYSYKF